MKNIFENRKANKEKLLNFGFKKEKNIFLYKTSIMDGDFNLTIKIELPDKLQTELYEIESNEIYTLHLSDAQGTFVGQVRDEYNSVLDKIQENCFDSNVFKFDYSYRVIAYAKEKYNDEMEYLWEKFPDNGIVRRKDNKKWYLGILTVKKSKFGFESDEKVEVIDLRSSDVENDTKQKNIYPGYHMNKKHWISIILDGSMDIEDIYKKIDESYILAK